MLSDEVVHMSDAAWQQRYLHLRGIRQQTGLARVDSLAHSEALYDWLEHQKALGVLGTALHKSLQHWHAGGSSIDVCR